MGQGLENVRKLYLEGIAGGEAREAIGKYTGHRYTQHSTGVGDGADGFLKFFEPFLERNPKREIEIVRIFEDGPWGFAVPINHSTTALHSGSRWTCFTRMRTD